MPRLSGRLVLVVVLGTVVLSFNFGSRLLLTNDDTRFPVLARDILANGHWLLPALPDGTPHLAKPPLGAWLIAITSWGTGSVSVRTAVLPSLLEAIGVVLLTYWFGRRLFGPDSGVVAGLTVATSGGIYLMAPSAMPDMAQLVAFMSALAVYVASGFGDRRTFLVAFYGIVAVGSLAKGAAGFLPLAIVLIDTITSYGAAGLKRLVSIPGGVVLAALAVPWWVVAASAGGHGGFLNGVILNDQLLWYFGRAGWSWRTIMDPFIHAVSILLPWVLLLPFAVRRAFREADSETVRRVRLLLIWLATVFTIMAVSGNQRDRYYLPLCPSVALLTGWWYTTLAWPQRARAFASAWIAVVAVGAVLVTLDTPRYNARIDLRALRAALAQAPAPLFAVDLQDLALSFNLDRPVVNSKHYERFENGVRESRAGYLIISDRALRRQSDDPCRRRIAAGLVTRRPFTALDLTECGQYGRSGRNNARREACRASGLRR